MRPVGIVGLLELTQSVQQVPLVPDQGPVQRQDLRVLVPVAHRHQLQLREHVGHSQVGQSKKHSRSSSRSRQDLRRATQLIRLPSNPIAAPTWADEIFGKRNVPELKTGGGDIQAIEPVTRQPGA
jgi:hypothetical protein